jgi:SAM-dependent methyltransferase
MMETTPQARNEALIRLIQRTRVDATRLYDSDALVDEKIRFMAAHCERVLDFGKSSRDRYSLFRPGQAITTDINQFDGYPDVIDDICNITNLPWETFDGIVCLAVLEHVYAPHVAVDNLHRLLKTGGYCLVYTPYFWRYHAPADLHYQDYFRFSRDALAYLFRDFSEVTIYPCRGRYSTIFNLFGFWKYRVERLFGQRVNRLLDKVLGAVLGREDVTQASGYFLWARK